MAKSRRVTKSRISARKPARVAKKRAPAARRRPLRGKAARPSVPVRLRTIHQIHAKARSEGGRQARGASASAPAPAPPVRKPTYHEAVAMYERGLQALQRRDFAASAEALRNVIERYPDERELLERARLYLKVCERELEPKEPAPKTADEWVVRRDRRAELGRRGLRAPPPAARADRGSPPRSRALPDGRCHAAAARCGGSARPPAPRGSAESRKPLARTAGSRLRRASRGRRRSAPPSTRRPPKGRSRGPCPRRFAPVRLDVSSDNIPRLGSRPAQPVQVSSSRRRPVFIFSICPKRTS